MNYIVKINEGTNKVLSFEEVSDNLSEMVSKSEELNQNAEPGIRYLPMAEMREAPRIGADATQEFKDKINPEAYAVNKQTEMCKDLEKAIKMLVSIDMTIRATNHVPVDVDVEDAHKAIATTVEMLFAVLMIHEKHKHDEEEKKDALDDLFKRLKGE